MSKPKIANNNNISSLSKLMNVSITSPKGSLIAEINNLRKQLKDYKQLKKQNGLIEKGDKATKDNHCQYHGNNNNNMTINSTKSPIHQQQKCMTSPSMSKTTKDKFFKSSNNSK